MSDTLEIFGVEYTGVTGIKATDNNGVVQTFINITEMDDYVVDKYTEGNWNVVKWNSGKAECYGIFTTTIPSGQWTAWGVLYEGQPSTPLAPTFPSGLFTEAPLLLATHGGAASACGLDLYGAVTKTQLPTIYVLRPNSLNSGNATYSINLHAIGKWK